MTFLDKIKNGHSIKAMSIDELNILASEIRGFLVDKVAQNGGHLASNLGIVELTIALYYVFDFPQDKVIWDVGHQSYVHKILSGRIDEFDALRKKGGISGFPKISESAYDSFNTGHASTSISAAVGMAKARDLKGEDNSIIAVIGDGSLSGGIAYEAINDAGNSKNPVIIILNDNKMSISKNVGAMSKYLNSFRTSKRYYYLKQKIGANLEKRENKKLFVLVKKVKDKIKNLLMPVNLFTNMGLTYFGPFDGHDIKHLIKMLKRIKNIDKPVIMHIRTIKGKGYEPAEQKPQDFHGVSSFSIKDGGEENRKNDYSTVFGEHLALLAEQNDNIVAISAAMPYGTGLNNFAEKYKNRFYDVGIAEEHAVTTAAGMAANGMVPVVAIYSTFMQRAFDCVLHDVCLQNLHVVLCADRAGLVGADGETHQGIFDISYMRIMPGMSIFVPSDFNSLKEMLSYAINVENGPVFIRYPKGCEQRKISYKSPFTPGKAEVLAEGEDVIIIACGNMVAEALEIKDMLLGVSCGVIDLRTIAPIDKELVCSAAKNARLVVTIEDNIKNGGMGEYVLEILNEGGIKTPVLIKAYENSVIEHATVSEQRILSHMDNDYIANEIKETLR